MSFPAKESRWLIESHLPSLVGIDMGTAVPPCNTHVFPAKDLTYLIESYLRSLAGMDMGTVVEPGNIHVYSCQGLCIAY